MVTAQDIFDMAMDLMDEQDESSGSTDTIDTREYKFRTISILNAGIQKLYPYSGNFTASGAGRPAADVLLTNRRNPDLSQKIPIDDALALALLPFYLASLLRAGEDMEFSARMMNEFNSALALLRDALPRAFEPIASPYGGF